MTPIGELVPDDVVDLSPSNGLAGATIVVPWIMFIFEVIRRMAFVFDGMSGIVEAAGVDQAMDVIRITTVAIMETFGSFVRLNMLD